MSSRIGAAGIHFPARVPNFPISVLVRARARPVDSLSGLLFFLGGGGVTGLNIYMCYSITVRIGVVRTLGLVGIASTLYVIHDIWSRRRSPGRQIVASSFAISQQGHWSLRWVCNLLPGDEGLAWWAELSSCVAEASDEDERRRYLHSFRRNVPRLVWTSWSEHLSGSRRRELL